MCRHKFATFLWLLPSILQAVALLNSLEQWGIQFNETNRSLEKVIADYFRAKTPLLGVAVNLQYTSDWVYKIEHYLSLAFVGKDLMKCETSTEGKKQSFLFAYNVWYVDSYKAFR